MRNYRTESGPFEQRPFYQKHEIESICLDELRSTELYPSSPSPVRVDRFVEKRFGVSPAYEDLPVGILGFTRFTAKGVESIVIARYLDTDGGKPADRRIRATIAHEAGHGLLHAHLFVPGAATQAAFGDFTEPAKPKVLCRDVHGISPTKTLNYRGNWWEYQANQMIGALLLPRALVISALEAFVVPCGLLGVRTLDEKRREAAARSLAEVFDVNPAVARIRVSEIYPADASMQLGL
jgi:hypothetical protein